MTTGFPVRSIERVTAEVLVAVTLDVEVKVKRNKLTDVSEIERLIDKVLILIIDHNEVRVRGRQG